MTISLGSALGDVQSWTPFLVIYAEKLVGPDVAKARALHPQATDAELLPIVRDDVLKHDLRGQLHFFGFLVDAAWQNQEFLSDLSVVIEAAVAALHQPQAVVPNAQLAFDPHTSEEAH